VTIRTRLLLGLLALAAVGLAFAGVVTYREQKQFLLERADQQLASALTTPNQVLNPDATATSDGQRPLPFGTYAEIRYDDGGIKRVTPAGLSYQEAPRLPSRVRVGATMTVHDPAFKVGAVRVQEFRSGREGTLIVAIPLKDASDSLQRLLFVETVVAFGVLVALAGLGWLVIRLGLRPLQQMQMTAGAIAAGDLSQRIEVVDETTEVGKLGLALNEMMTKIEDAFEERAASEDRLRQFVGDASHELRTPLTSIRGYAELFRRGAADRPEDLAKAMRRIEEEADRMGVLVDDLLLLARLDQGRPLERTPIDLGRIARDAIDDLRTVAPDRPIDFTAPVPVVVPGDDTRLRQVLANLLQNANRHTPAGTPVHVRVFTDGDDAVIEVADEGPGMEPEEAKRVFERFWRSDPARTRASGGAGLGLSIVAAIAEAHGGRATVDATPGVGATFRIFLPRQVDETEVGEPPSTPPPVADIPVTELEDATPND
jgi:two-component system OmpR family sensor kinase